MDLRARAREVAEQVISFRRDLHMYPEASMQEFRTTDRIAAELDKLGIPYRRLEPTGLVADIKGGRPGKTIALRADIDALSITEQTDLDFKSRNEGFMHACGHDTHAAMLMGAAAILNGIRDQLQGNVRLIFQPAEETGEGAKAVVAQGGLEGVDMIFGLHISGNGAPTGAVTYCPGAAASASDRFSIKVKGKAGHGAMPDACVDATVAAAAIVMNLQTMVSRELPPTQPAVVTVGKLESGSRFNIVSGEAIMEGTCRCYDVAVHQKLPGILTRIAQQTAAAFRCEAEVQYGVMSKVLVNDDGVLELAKKAAAKVVDREDMLYPVPAMMGGEDFSEYTALVKGAFMMVGGGTPLPNHSDYIVFDEDSFRTGVALHCQVVLDYLNGEE